MRHPSNPGRTPWRCHAAAITVAALVAALSAGCGGGTAADTTAGGAAGATLTPAPGPAVLKLRRVAADLPALAGNEADMAAAEHAAFAALQAAVPTGLQTATPASLDHSETQGKADASITLGSQTDADGTRTSVKIDAADPGSVLTGSSTVINVAVKQVVEGTELHQPVSVSLSGEKSASPSRIESSPGPVTYVAPDQAGASATLTLKTLSRRGMDTKTLALRTRDPVYHISGGGEGLEVDDSVGALDKPFSFRGTFPGSEVVFSCTPANPRSGSVSGDLSGSGATGHVSGSCSIVGPDAGPLTMTQTTYGCVDNLPGSCRTVTSVSTLTP